MRAYKITAAFKSHGVLIEPSGEWTPPNQATADRLIAAGCLKGPPGSGKAGVSRIPSVAEFVAAGVPAPEALGFLAMLQAIADGKSAEEAHGAGDLAARAAQEAAEEHDDDADPEGDSEPTGDTPPPEDPGTPDEPPKDQETTPPAADEPPKPGLIDRAKAAITGSDDKPKGKGGKRGRK